MNTVRYTFSLVLGLALWIQVPAKAAPTRTDASGAIEWVRPQGADMDPIFAQARTANKPVFLYWGAVWCPPCNQVKATVFNRPDFVERSRWFVPVYLDGDTPGAQKLGAQFKVRGYPTMILLRPDGQEITRLPGEVDARSYMEVLQLGLASAGGVREALARALAGGGTGQATSTDWRLLAYYAWDQDEGQVLPKTSVVGTLHRLAQRCPVAFPVAKTRLALKATVAARQQEQVVPDSAATLALVRQTMANRRMVQANADVLINYASEIVGALTLAQSDERHALVPSYEKVLRRLADDSHLSRMDRLGAVQAQVVLAKLDLKDQPEIESTWRPDASLLRRVRIAVQQATQGGLSPYERQALVPGAADLLSEVRLWDESDALLKAELDKAVSPYYHMLILASNSRARGDVASALNWSEKAWEVAQGSATRLQWGVGYVSRLTELAPADVARIEKAASAVLAEMEAVPENFYERNRRSLERLGKKLKAWEAHQPERQASLARLVKLWDGTCARLPAQDEARAACSGVFAPD